MLPSGSVNHAQGRSCPAMSRCEIVLTETVIDLKTRRPFSSTRFTTATISSTCHPSAGKRRGAKVLQFGDANGTPVSFQHEREWISPFTARLSESR